MTTPQLLHFVVKNVTYAATTTGYLVTCYTNYACHLWLRWTNVPTQKHVNPIVVRGAPVGTFIDQCFVVYNDIEQNEPGDTFTHTFTVEPWPPCQTRWFYFWGTVGGVLSPSASAIFTQRQIGRTIIYSDPGGGLTTVDGFAWRLGASQTWHDLRTSPGTFSDTNSSAFNVTILCSASPNLYNRIYRVIMTFNLASLPPGIQIQSAALKACLRLKTNNFSQPPSLAVVESHPTNPNTISPADYLHLESGPLSNIISHAAFSPGSFATFTLTQSGLAKLVPGQIVKLGLMEQSWDATNIPPPWGNNYSCNLDFYSVDELNPALRPYLEILHTCPPL